MLSLLDSAILGTVQGLTEFLPVSSSGHLILARELLHINTESGLAFDAVLQLGTILAVFVYFRTDIIRLIRTAIRLCSGQKNTVADTDRTLLLGILLGTTPAILLGILLEKAMDSVFRSALLVACTLVAGSALMIYAERKAVQHTTNPTLKHSWWIGIFQTLALVPGISRSGATISGGLILGLTREAATRFSFLLSLPIITGSGLVKLLKIIKHPPTDFTLTTLLIGFLLSFVVGYIAIRWLIEYLKRHSLMAFVWYRLALATIVFITTFRIV